MACLMLERLIYMTLDGTLSVLLLLLLLYSWAMRHFRCVRIPIFTVQSDI